MIKKTILTGLFLVIGIAVASATSQFSHLAHVEVMDLEECEFCHVQDSLNIVPDVEVCEKCHPADYLRDVEFGGIETHTSFWYESHKNFARREAAAELKTQCDKCHQESFCLDCHRGSFPDENLEANIHRSEYLVTHPIMARGDSRSCASCHEERFCTDCHNRFNRNELRLESHRRSWSDLPGLGPPHSTFDVDDCDLCHPGVATSHVWSSNHAREARRDLQLCQSCHERAEVCITCHSARTGLRVNPHPGGWNDIKDNIDQRVCRRCH
jgi:hypothetical protein